MLGRVVWLVQKLSLFSLDSVQASVEEKSEEVKEKRKVRIL
jgi:hypothetical protein